MGLAPIIADGRAVALNYFDNRIYCFGTGPSATTITASPKVTSAGGTILIEGTVTDQSPGAKNTAAIADDKMSAWMEYVYEDWEIPADAIGVSVKLAAVDAGGASTDLGTVTSDMSGAFSQTWTPTASGKYTIVATFEGTKSYGSSYAETAVAVTAAPSASASTTPAVTTPPPTATPAASPTASPAQPTPPGTDGAVTLYVAVAAVVIIAAIAAVALILRRRK
jgi:hypothetical protein